MRRAALRRRLLLVLRIGIVVGILVGLSAGGDWVLRTIVQALGPLDQGAGRALVGGAVGLFILTLALPFVPGMEIGLALMMLLKGEGIALVYGSTLVALSLSFLAGRLLPLHALARLLGWLRLPRARDFVTRLAPLSPEERLALLVSRAPLRLVPFLLRHRYVAIAIVFNLPGNALLGGGGGIGMLAGMSRLFHYPAYLLTVCVAISPIPLLLLTRHTWPLLSW